MRITISSPDGLGDFILRLPLFEALRAAGHELQIFMREPAATLAAALLSEAQIECIAEDPYARLVRFRRNPFLAERAKLKRFAPDLLVTALFQHSFFDEILLAKRPGSLPVAGFRSSEPFWGTLANTLPEQIAACLSIAVEVSVDLPEQEKARRLAEAILESSLPARSLRVAPPATALDHARTLLRSNGLEEGRYWIACVGSRQGLELKDWGESNWSSALSRIASETGEPLVFLGNRAEAASIERIRNTLAGTPRHLEMASQPLLTSWALIALSAGYLGRDSGPMHLAAASGRQLLAIFSGTVWGRFFPDADPGVIVSRHVPCQGCLGYCHLPEPFCVRRVRVDQFFEGWKLLRSGAVRGTKVMEIPLDEALTGEIAAHAHCRYVPLAHETRRESFASGRSVNLLDTAGLLLRTAARHRYTKQFHASRPNCSEDI